MGRNGNPILPDRPARIARLCCFSLFQEKEVHPGIDSGTVAGALGVDIAAAFVGTLVDPGEKDPALAIGCQLTFILVFGRGTDGGTAGLPVDPE